MDLRQRKTEDLTDGQQQIAGVELRADQYRSGDPRWIDFGEKSLGQGRLARADFAGQYDES